MSAALKRRFNFELVEPIPNIKEETALVRRQAVAALERAGAPYQVDDAVLDVLVTAFRGRAPDAPGLVQMHRDDGRHDPHRLAPTDDACDLLLVETSMH